MSTEFDRVINRTNTSSLKWERFDSDVIPLWVADMDFQSAPEILAALHQRIDHGVFGYTTPDIELAQLVVDRCHDLYQWDIKPEWIVWMPGLVSAINVCVRAYANEGEGVISPVPVYYPFLMAPGLGGRDLLEVHWVKRDHQWELDLQTLEKNITAETKLLLLCNPQNPNGRVLTQAELKIIAAFCQQHNLIVCSDEVHCDLILDQNARHIPFASMNEFAREHSVTLMSPSKTFNLAGFGCAFAVIPNTRLRQQFNRVRKGIVPDPDNMLIGYTATKAAYRFGEPWRHRLLEYLRANHDYLLNAINQIPSLSMEPLQATYLAWIDVSELQLNNPLKFFEQAGVGVSAGEQFGDKQYIRLNFGCSRALLEEAVARIVAVLSTDE